MDGDLADDPATGRYRRDRHAQPNLLCVSVMRQHGHMTQPRSPICRVVSRTIGTATVIEVAGEIDLLTAGDVEAAINAGAATAEHILVIDLTEVSFLGSAGLGVLARGQMTTGQRVALRVVATSPAVLRPIRLTGMDKLLAMFETVADALESGPELAT